ncbi:DUF7266 family protein [Halomarina oriensis]|uniref:DUF7266 family protein n=1 Tax=Halomarina oriensis TaxID=671145 RepID=UPI0018EF25D4|nr:hypothetical protein [Halomarina oriensis]
MDDRGVSTTIGYVSTLGIAAILISGLLMAGGGFVDDQRERTIRSEMQVIGQQMVADIDATDRLARTGGSTEELTVRHQFPSRVTGAQYTVDVVNDGGQLSLVLEAADPDVTVEIPFDTRLPLDEGSVRGGDLLVRCVDTTGGPACDELEVTSG